MSKIIKCPCGTVVWARDEESAVVRKPAYAIRAEECLEVGKERHA